jgi:hypothetical protein
LICVTSNFFLEKPNSSQGEMEADCSCSAAPTIRPRRAPSGPGGHPPLGALGRSRQPQLTLGRESLLHARCPGYWSRAFDVVAKRILERLEHACGGRQELALLVNKPGGRCVRPKIWQALRRIVFCRRAVIDRWRRLSAFFRSAHIVGYQLQQW